MTIFWQKDLKTRLVRYEVLARLVYVSFSMPTLLTNMLWKPINFIYMFIVIKFLEGEGSHLKLSFDCIMNVVVIAVFSIFHSSFNIFIMNDRYKMESQGVLLIFLKASNTQKSCIWQFQETFGPVSQLIGQSFMSLWSVSSNVSEVFWDFLLYLFTLKLTFLTIYFQNCKRAKQRNLKYLNFAATIAFYPYVAKFVSMYF